VLSQQQQQQRQANTNTNSNISTNTSSASKNNYLHQKHSTIQNLPITKPTLANHLH
jgi:hypothetical protein